MKTCSKCRIEKPFSLFSKLSSAKDGLQSQCKQCKGAYAKAWAKANPEEKKARQAQFNAKNPEWMKEYQSEYYKENREERLAYSKQYAENNRERMQAYRAAYYETNKGRITTYIAQYRQDNKDKHAKSEAKRRATKLNATPTWLTEDDHDVIGWIYEMREERTKATGVAHHVDHIVPLQGSDVCGLHVWWNMQLLPASENISKSNTIGGYDGICA